MHSEVRLEVLHPQSGLAKIVEMGEDEGFLTGVLALKTSIGEEKSTERKNKSNSVLHWWETGPLPAPEDLSQDISVNITS